MNLKILVTGAIVLSLALFSCTSSKTKYPQAEISDVPEVDFEINRYGKTLFELDTTDFQNELKRIKPDYTLFLDADLNDSSNIRTLYNYVTDTQLISLYKKSVEVYPDMLLTEKELSDAFARFAYLFPGQSVPQIYTYISDMYFEQPVWIQDSIMVVAIDLYLGSDFSLYSRLGLPFYKVKWMEPQSLPIDVMKAIYFDRVTQPYKSQTLLDRMIDAGKLLAFLDAVFPDLPDGYKISYSPEQLNWANENEENIWAFLLENELLYSKDYQTQTKLIQDAPFTTGFGNESPPRLGVFIGWEIVLSYLRNNPDVSLEEVIRMKDSQLLLKNSGYRP